MREILVRVTYEVIMERFVKIQIKDEESVKEWSDKHILDELEGSELAIWQEHRDGDLQKCEVLPPNTPRRFETLEIVWGDES